MSFKLSKRSRERLVGVNPALVLVVEMAIERSEIEFVVTEGLRSAERQAALVKAGASRTLKSRHLTGHAVDVAALIEGEVRWDWPLYGRIAKAFKAASTRLDIPVVWGGDWRTFKDGPHFELSRVKWP